MRLVIVGGGRMGRALLGGLLRSGWVEPAEIGIVEPVETTRHELSRRFAGVAVSPTPVPAEAAVLAVKPADAEAGATSLVDLGLRRLVSIVAGVTTAHLQSWLGEGPAVIRAMPNMPAVLGSGATAVAGGKSATEDDFAWAEAVLSSFGVVARVPEKLLDAVTGLSGSGPAYVFLLAEALEEAGVAQGIEREVSHLLVVHTLLGAARMLVEMGEPAAALRSAVTSPGGTTAAGLRSLERLGMRSALIEAVAVATERARELGLEAEAGGL
jgi:pyrroline-5-carboxylate reductase